MPRYGFKVERKNGHRSSYDWHSDGEPSKAVPGRDSSPETAPRFVMIRHYLPQPIHGKIDDMATGPDVHIGPNEPNIADPIEMQFPALAIHKEDWPDFLKVMHLIYMGVRLPIEARQLWMGIEPNEQPFERMLNAPVLDEREVAMISHAIDYAVNHSASGAPGHGLYLLIAKMANMLGA